LHEDDDDDDDDEDSLPTVASTSGGDRAREGPSGERAPLLGRQGSKFHKRSKSGPPVGTASVTQATLMVSLLRISKEHC
jgi:hypothetical protein